ncbi:MAG: DUF502 domain-containing protein [Syntrophomonadaceae bacterium]|nr:DUF502 domain-containing protein [Syntrophomonadaceae bacterium]
MKKLINYFLEGLLFMVPLFLTLYIFYIVFQKIDGLLRIPLPVLGVVPGVGFLATVLLVIVVGFLVSNFLTKRIFIWLDRILNRLPLIKLLYGSLKDLLGAFVGDKKSFTQPVLVQLVDNGSAHVLGFITCESLASLGLEDYVSVYVPQSYNFAGQLLVFPRQQVKALDANSADMMTFIVSGGVAGSKAEHGRN